MDLVLPVWEDSGAAGYLPAEMGEKGEDVVSLCDASIGRFSSFPSTNCLLVSPTSYEP